MRGWSSNMRGWSSNMRGWSSNMRGWSSNMRGWSSNMRGWSSNMRGWSGSVRSGGCAAPKVPLLLCFCVGQERGADENKRCKRTNHFPSHGVELQMTHAQPPPTPAVRKSFMPRACLWHQGGARLVLTAQISIAPLGSDNPVLVDRRRVGVSWEISSITPNKRMVRLLISAWCGAHSTASLGHFQPYAMQQVRLVETMCVLLIVAVLLCVCACQGAGAQAIHLRYAQAYSSLQTIFALPLLVAERNGYFVREDLDFSMLAVPGGGDRLVAVLHDGTADIAHVPTPLLIETSLAGSDAVAARAAGVAPTVAIAHEWARLPRSSGPSRPEWAALRSRARLTISASSLPMPPRNGARLSARPTSRRSDAPVVRSNGDQRRH